MALGNPLTRYRPTRTADGEGGWSESFVQATYAFFGVLKLHQNRVSVLLDWYEDVRVGDYIAVTDDTGPAAFYRVTDRQRLLGAPRAEIGLERVERPIYPVDPKYIVTASGYGLVSAGGALLIAG